MANAPIVDEAHDIGCNVLAGVDEPQKMAKPPLWCPTCALIDGTARLVLSLSGARQPGEQWRVHQSH
ncbi:hypothetical protein HUJ04_000148 [Dendroctonus ponderosae]|nr:hypothetical protein HUJ04_000148 [Dendroctonus ponderosae]